MRYYVTIGERTFEVWLGDDGMRIDGEDAAAELSAVPGTPMHHLLLDGASHLLHADGSGGAGSWVLHGNGVRLEADVVDERTRAIRALTARSAGPRGPKAVRAPMPGLVVRLLVEVGQSVQADQGVAIVEAMKMENELKADAAGVVDRIIVKAGQTVEKGTVMIEFQAEEAT